MSAGTRFRMVTDTPTEQHVSSVVIGRDEVVAHLMAEAFMHRANGWEVTLVDGGETGPDFVDLEIVCRRADSYRLIRACPYSPWDDTR